MESKRDPIIEQEHKPTVFEKFMLDTFPSVQSYCNQKMQGKSSDPSGSSSGQTSGFYSSEKIFKQDYDTFASNPERVKRFAAGWAYQIFCTREKLIAEGTISESDAFNVLECGGGDGNLCFHIFQIIEAMAKEDKKWKALFDTMHYYLVELSSGLVAAQTERNKQYIEKNKVTVTEGNALDLDSVLTDLKFGVCLANELADMFQPHVISKNPDGTLTLHQTLPFISLKELKKHVTQEQLLEIAKKSDIYKKYITKQILGTSQRKNLVEALKSADKILLSNTEFQKWHRCPMTYAEVDLVSAHLVPSIKAFLQRHPEFVKAMKTGKRLIEDGSFSYLGGMQRKVIPGGLLGHTGYGEDAHTRVNDANRTYKDKVQGYDIYQPNVDITHNVNFTIYAEEGKQVGLHVLHYGVQSTLSVAAFPKHILSDKDKASYDLVANVEPFMVIILVSGESKKFPDGLNPYTDSSMPVLYEELAALPPIYTPESGIKLHQHDIQILTYAIAYFERERLLIIKGSDPSTLPSPEEGNRFRTLNTQIPILSKMLKQKPLESDEMKAIKNILGIRLSTYPTVEGIKKRLSSVASPVTASGDAHDHLVRVIENFVNGQKNEFKPFLEAINQKNYSQALRRISTAHSDFAFDVTKLFLEEVKKIPKFKANEAEGEQYSKLYIELINDASDEKQYSALHIAATRNNQRVYDLLVSERADVSQKDAAGNVAGFYLKPIASFKPGQ